MANVSVAKPKAGGAVWTAPKGTALPSDTTTALNQSFKSLGYISEDGVKNTISRDTEDIKAWGGDLVLRPQTGFADDFGMTFIETLNLEVLKAVYGSSAITGTAMTSGVSLAVSATEVPAASWVIDTVMTDGAARRLVIPNGQITDLGEIKYSDGEAVGYEVTITAYPDATGKTHYEYTKTPSTGGGN